MSGSSPSLRELIDIDELQSIQDSFARAAGISSVILSAEGEPLTRLTDPTGFCSLIQSTEKGKERCFQSFMEMGEIALRSETAEIFYCFAHVGHFVAPIMIGGEHKGTMFAGQFIHGKFSSEQLHDLEEIAHEIDLDPGMLVKEAGKMRVVEEGVIRNYSSLLFKIVEIIARRGGQAVELERRVQERTDELAEANKGLTREIAERKRVEEALKDRVKFEKIVTAISTGFINLAPDEVDAGIGDALQSIGEFAGVDRSYVFQFSDNKTKMDNTHEWCAWGIVPQIGNLKGLLVADFPWLMGGLNRFETVHIPSVADLPHGAGAEKELLQSQDILSATFVPMVYGRTLVGYIGFDSVRQEKRWSEDSTALLRIVGEIFVNVLERKRAMTTLRESEEKIRAITASANDAVIMMGDEARITYWNPAAEQIFGYTEEEAIGRDLHKTIVPERFHDDFLKGVEVFIETGQGNIIGKSLELDAVRKDGTEFPIELSISAVKIAGSWNAIGMIKDITERKAAENTLRESEEKYRNIIENIQEVFYRADMEGNLVMISPSGAKQMGYDSVEDMLGLNIAKTFYAVPEERDEFLKILEEKGAVNDYEITLKKTDGTLVPVRLSSHPYFDKSGNLLGVEGFLSDITERKRAEDEIRKKTEELEGFNKLAVGREVKMIELKKEINALLWKLGEKPEYEIAGES